MSKETRKRKNKKKTKWGYLAAGSPAFPATSDVLGQEGVVSADRLHIGRRVALGPAPKGDEGLAI